MLAGGRSVGSIGNGYASMAWLVTVEFQGNGPRRAWPGIDGASPVERVGSRCLRFGFPLVVFLLSGNGEIVDHYVFDVLDVPCREAKVNNGNG